LFDGDESEWAYGFVNRQAKPDFHQVQVSTTSLSGDNQKRVKSVGGISAVIPTHLAGALQ
jgi:hypothetical protein